MKINISIWGPDVRTLDIPIQSLITATSVTVRDYFGDKSVNCLLTNFRITDDFPEAEQIRKRTANYWLNTNVKSEVNDTLMDDECGFGENETPASVKYTTIKELLETGDLERKYNVVGLVIKRLEPISQSTKNARDSWMQMIVVTDDEDNDIKLTVWGDKVRECDVPLYSVISAQEVIVRQFNGRKTLSCLWSQLRINPLIPQIDELTNLNAVYLERQRNGQTSKSFKHRCNVVDIVFTPYEEILTNNNREIRYNVLGIVVALTPIKTIKTKEKKLCVKVITVIDEKPTQIDLAVWGEESMDDEILLHSAIIAKNVKLEEYKQQLRLSCFWDSMIIEPYIAEIDKLKEAALTYNVIPRLLFPLEFPRISEIKKAATVDSQWDIIGFVNKVYDSSKISREKSTSNEPVVLREIRLKDSRRNLLCLSIWGNEGKEKNIEKGSIIAVKGATVRIFDGKMTFNCYWNSVKINPDIPAVERLKQFKKDYENYRNFPERAAKYEIYGDYTPFEVIMRRNASTQPFHTIGLIVQVDVKPSAEDTSEECTVKSCILRDRNGYEINLLIRGSRNFPFSIPLHCLVAVRDASLSKSENLILICGYPNIIFNIDLYYNLDIPEVKGFKDAAMDALVRHEQPEAPKNFTAFSEINWRTSLGKGIKIVGIVVRIIQRDEPDFESPRRLRKDTCTLRVTLRDKNSDLISLNIKETSDLEISDVSISLHSVISVQDAILRVSFGDRTLWCCWKNVQINPDIAEKKELEILRELPFEGDYMSFKVIKLAQDDLIDYKMDIIGHVVEVLGIKCNNWRKTENEALVDVPTLSQMQQNKIQQNEMMETTSEMKTEKERQKIKKEEYPKHYLEVILRNQIDLKLRILGLPQRLYDLERILLNRIICARDAKVVVQKTLSKEFDECQTVLETDSSLVKIDPKILEKVGGANAVRIVPIEQIHSKARAGDVVGLLAIVIEFPKRIHPFIDDPSFSEESEDDAKETGRKYTFRRVKLLDSSGKKITMLIPIPVVASLRENISEIVVVHVTNLRVCEFEGQLEVEYTPLSLIKINSKIEETETVHRLLQWYKEFRTTKIKEAKVSKVSIKGVLENACRNKIVSIIGIFVNTYWREEFIGNVRVLRRLIQIVDTSQEIIDIVLRINQARMFNVPLFSVVMVENLIVYTDGPSRARGTAGPATRFLVNPTDLENLPDTQRLKNWFPGFWKDFNNSATNNEAILPESFELMKKQNRYLENIKVKDISKEDKEEETGIASDRELVSKSEFLGQDNAGCADYYPDIYLSDMNQAEASEKENGINQCNESVDIFADC